MRKPSRSLVAETTAVVLGMTAVTIVMTYPVARVATTALPSDPGDPLLNAWILAWDADRIAHGFRGLWDLPAFFPYPHTLLYTEHLLGIAILVAPIEWMTRNPILAYNTAFLLSFIVAGGGMYGLVRSLTGSPGAAWLAGLIYAFCPYRASMLSHLQVLWSGWLAVTLWALHRYFQTRSRASIVVLASAFLLQAWSNGYFLYYSLVPLLVIGLAEATRTRPEPARLLRDSALALVIVAAGIAPIAVAYAHERQSQGLVRSYEEIASYRADLGSYLRAPDEIRLWRWLPGPAMLEGDLFPGLTALALAASVWARRHRSIATVPYAAVGGVGFMLSLGPTPAVWGHELFSHAPYEWLMRVVPGFDGLRVPARFAVLVYLSIAVLAGVGAAAVLHLMAPRRRWLLTAALSVAILAEGYVAPVPVATIPAMTRGDRGAYLWLRDRPPGGVVEFPIQRPLSHSPLVYRTREPAGYVNTFYQYRTLVHHHPIVNGHSGYEPLLNVVLRRLTEEHRLGDALLMLRSVGVRYAIVHPPESSTQPLPRVSAQAVEAEGQHVGAPVRLDETTAFRLKPWEPEIPAVDAAALQRVPASAFRATASEALDRVPLAFDEIAGSRWLSARPQTGQEWIEIDFDRPRRVARIDLDLGPHFSDYPRWLIIDARTADRSVGPLYEGSVLPWLARGLVRSPATAPIEIALRAQPVIALTLRQTGRSAAWHWSVHELRVWERR